MNTPDDTSSPDLRVTLRCLQDELRLAPEDAGRHARELDHEICAAFVTQRSQNPIGVEKLQPITSNIEAYTLHAGRWRGVTWHDEEDNVVWLLGFGYHRSGEAGDAYPYLKQLDADGALLPTRADYDLLYELRDAALPSELRRLAFEMLESARSSVGEEIRGVLAGAFPVSVVVENEGGLEAVWLAVSHRLIKGELDPPPEWLRFVVAAFFPDAGFEDIQSPEQKLPTRETTSYEVVYLWMRGY
jgi:hypothetical protein